MTVSRSLIAAVLASVTFNAVAQTLLRKAMVSVGPEIARSNLLAAPLVLTRSGVLWLGLIAFGVSLAIWLYVLSRLPVGVAYPMASLGYVAAAAIGALFLGEQVRLGQAVGIGVICLGVVILARSG
jgi:multidrug transporter EmrE-like cation transporter